MHPPNILVFCVWCSDTTPSVSLRPPETQPPTQPCAKVPWDMTTGQCLPKGHHFLKLPCFENVSLKFCVLLWFSWRDSGVWSFSCIQLFCMMPELITNTHCHEVAAMIIISLQSENNGTDLPGGPVVRTPCFHCRGHGFNSWSGN